MTIKDKQTKLDQTKTGYSTITVSDIDRYISYLSEEDPDGTFDDERSYHLKHAAVHPSHEVLIRDKFDVSAAVAEKLEREVWHYYDNKTQQLLYEVGVYLKQLYYHKLYLDAFNETKDKELAKVIANYKTGAYKSLGKYFATKRWLKNVVVIIMVPLFIGFWLALLSDLLLRTSLLNEVPVWQKVLLVFVCPITTYWLIKESRVTDKFINYTKTHSL